MLQHHLDGAYVTVCLIHLDMNAASPVKSARTHPIFHGGSLSPANS